MSSDPNYNTSNDSEENDLSEYNSVEYDSDDQAFFQILQQHKVLLQLAESSSRRSKRRRYVVRDREGAHTQLVKDYFSDDPTWSSDIFRQRFRMRKELFIHIVDALESHDEYFTWRADATGRKCFSPLQKCTIAIRQLAYGGPADHHDEYLRVAETTVIDCLFNFCRCVIEIFGERYLRRPDEDDCRRLLRMHEQRHGFPGMLGSLDCMHREWKNCPVAWKGQFTRGDQGVPTIMLEAVASADLWIWHTFFVVASSNKDINVLNQFPLFNDVLQGKAPQINFTVNRKQYVGGYYLTDGIYPEWASFAKSFPCLLDRKRKKFKEMQEAARKDVERAFGVLQSRWAIIRDPGRFWCQSNLKDIMYACIILHNMIVENEGDMFSDLSEEVNHNDDNASPVLQGPIGGFSEYLKRDSALRDKEKHHQLRADLVDHIWERFGNI